jgi:hypothetical protein
MRTGSYIPDAPWPQVDPPPPQRGRDTAVFVGHRTTIVMFVDPAREAVLSYFSAQAYGT